MEMKVPDSIIYCSLLQAEERQHEKFRVIKYQKTLNVKKYKD